MITIRPFQLSDIEEAVTFTSFEDKVSAELMEFDIRKALTAQHARGEEMYSAWADGQIVAIWGFHANSLLSPSVYVWMLTTTVAVRAGKAFARESWKQREKIFARFPEVTGVCMATHKRSLRWLKWLGATFDTPTDHGRLQLVPFTIRRD